MVVRTIHRKFLQLSWLMVMIFSCVSGQVTDLNPDIPGGLGSVNSALRITGQFGYHSQLYNMQSTGGLPLNPRRPGDLHRFMINPVLQAGDFRMPVTMIFSSRQTSTISMQLPAQSFGQYMRNPLNTFSISPSYKWIKVHVGSQMVRYSDLTTGDLKMFGAGFDLAPGKWTISAFSGIARQAIESDTLRRIAGQYQRQFQAVRAGYGQSHAFHVFLNAARMKDDSTTLLFRPANLRPQEGVAASLVLGLPLSQSIIWHSEVAASIFTRDKRSAFYSSPKFGDVEPLVDLHRSTRADFSGRTSLTLNRTSWSVRLHALYVGDGFVAPGYPYLETDRIDLTIDPTFRLLDNSLVLGGTIGYRVNNLSDTKMQTTDQLLLAFNANYAASESFGLGANYSNFGVRTGFSYDTLRIEIVSQSYGLSPYFQLASGRGAHRIISSFSYDEYEDNNLVSGQTNDQRSLNIFLNHQFAFDNNPLTTNFSVNYLNSLSQDVLMENFMIQGGSSLRLFENKMNISLNLSYVHSSIGGFSPDNAWMIRPGFRYAVTRQISARLDGSIRLYRYGSARPGTTYTENLLRTAISYRF